MGRLGERACCHQHDWFCFKSVGRNPSGDFHLSGFGKPLAGDQSKPLAASGVDVAYLTQVPFSAVFRVHEAEQSSFSGLLNRLQYAVVQQRLWARLDASDLHAV